VLRGGRGLFEKGDWFKYFRLREGAIIRGRRLMEGRLLFEEIRYCKTVVGHGLCSDG